ncbi:MAG: hypothetical protein HDP34_05785 [Clostridia bacterium]|nr:hypothetical protein [Clostridia bacterium]
MTKFLKISLIVLLSILIVIASLFAAFFIVTRDAKLDESKLINPNQTILIYDENGNEVVNASLTGNRKSVSLNALPEHTVNAFIASEDRTFFTHDGLNYKRMLKALYKNVVSRSFKEGASTISQQLIKNTHLSNEKTIKRKLDEIKLTKQLEKRYTKNEILEMYLNTIYFGHNCYGLESASEFYFDKKAENLSLTESATLVGLLTSPNNYSPFKNPEKSLSRRNTVLNAMNVCGYITDSELEEAKNAPLNAAKTRDNGKNSDYIDAVFEEFEEIDLNIYELTSGCKIYTYLNQELQSFIEKLQFETDNSIVVTDKSGGVNACKSTINLTKRQPGSTVKPFAVYAPAIEEKQLSPFTKILDEKIDYNGYSPENSDKKFHGYVSVTDSIIHSYNVPAVKTLNALTLNTAEKYLTRMNIGLDDDEKNLSLALGGMKYGLGLKDITDCYSIFRDGGTYAPSRFISKIVSANGKTLYKHDRFENRVFSNGTCSLMNEILMQTAKTGTAKKLKNFNFDVAAKTGTCGNESGNTDAYAVGYTSEHSLGVWLGDKNNERLSVTGGGEACACLKQLLEELYKNGTPANLDVTTGTSTVNIDAEEYYDNNKIIVADPLCPKLNVLTVKVKCGSEPKEKSNRFSSPSIPTPTISVKNNAVNIELCHAKYYAFLIKRSKSNGFEVIYDGKWKETITDKPEEGYYTYTVTPYFLSGENKIYGQEIALPAVSLKKNNSSVQIKIPDIANDEWYNL